MATEILEDSELSALAPSRLGNRSFVDDKVYSNASGSTDSADKNFINKMMDVFNRIKGDKGVPQKTAKEKLAESPSIVFDAVRRYGVPKNLNDLRQYNAAVAVLKEYPLSADMTCEQLSVYVESLDNQIEANTKSIASGVAQRVANRPTKVLNDLSKEAKAMMIKMQCSLTKEQADLAANKAETLLVLEKAGATATGEEDNTTKYILYGVGGIIAIAAIVILLKR